MIFHKFDSLIIWSGGNLANSTRSIWPNWGSILVKRVFLTKLIDSFPSEKIEIAIKDELSYFPNIFRCICSFQVCCAYSLESHRSTLQIDQLLNFDFSTWSFWNTDTSNSRNYFITWYNSMLRRFRRTLFSNHRTTKSFWLHTVVLDDFNIFTASVSLNTMQVCSWSSYMK